MKWRIAILIIFAFIFYNYAYLSAQERIGAREEARQHYLQGKEFYSQGRYQEATSEFETAIVLISRPEIDLLEKIQTEQEKALTPKTTEITTKVTKGTVLISRPEIDLSEKIQTEQEKVLAPRVITKPSVSQEKLARQKEEAAVTKTVAAEKPAPETGEREYYIDIGDILDISVWQTPDLSRSEVIVRPDGKISFPLIGDVKTEGLTLTQLDEIITEKLKTYLKFPEVSIMIRRFGEQSNKVVILGEIFSPGIYKFGGPPTITEALAAAGGYTTHAVLNSIMVIRGDARTKPEAIRVNFAKIIKSAALSENIVLRPNDIIYVPRSFIGKINTFLEIIQPAISEYFQTLNARVLHNTMHRNQ